MKKTYKVDKVLFLGDTHFGARRDSLAFQDHFTKFYTHQLLPYIKDNNIKYIIQFGDFFDNRKSTNTRTLRYLKDIFIDPLAELGCEMFILCGNHDLFHKNIMQPNNIRENLNHYKHLHIIDEITTVKLGKTSIDLVPWICEENEQNIVDYINESKSDICCGHFELSGFNMHRGMINEHGKPSNFLNKYHAVYSGHYHTSSDGENIKYLGTPYEITWNDCGDLKGFYIFDTNSQTTEFQQNPYKMHHKIIYSDKNEPFDLDGFDYNFHKEAFIKIIVDVKHDIPAFERFVEKLWKNSEPLDITITDITLAYRDVDIESIETQDPLTALINTIDNDKANTVNMDVNSIKKLAEEIHSEALLMVYEG